LIRSQHFLIAKISFDTTLSSNHYQQGPKKAISWLLPLIIAIQ